MKKYLTVITLIIQTVFISVPLFAQKAQIKASYDYHFFDPRGIKNITIMSFLREKIVPSSINEHTQWVDSMRCTKEGAQWYIQTDH